MTVTLEEVAYRVLPRVNAGRALADVEWATLKSAAEVFVSESPVAISPEKIADNVEAFLIAGRSKRAWRVRVLLTLIEYIPLPFYGLRFSDLSVLERRRVIEERMIHGRNLWGICAKIRMLVTMGIYGDAVAQPAIGFVPVPLRNRHIATRGAIEPASLTQ